MWLFVDEGENADPLVCRDRRLKWKQLRTSAATVDFKGRNVRVNIYLNETFNIITVGQDAYVSRINKLTQVSSGEINNCKPGYYMGYAVAQLVEALRYKQEGRGFDSRWSHWNFSLT